MTKTRIAGLALLLAAAPAAAAGNAQRGEAAFRACAACHALAPGAHLTGPSLAGVVGRRAGTAPGFTRYSEALKGSGLTWDEATLDAWLRNPAALVPGNAMLFPGLREAGARADLIAFLKAGPRGGAGANPLPDLKGAQPASRVQAIRYCGDAYRVATADGATRTFWEFNLRFKTDGSPRGPAAGSPVLMGGGMQGDRAFVVFAHPDEFARFVKPGCE